MYFYLCRGRFVSIIFRIAFCFGLVLPYYSSGQNKTYWGVVADVGTSFNRTSRDTLTSQKLLLPSFGLSVRYGKVIAHGVTLQATLGYRNRGGVASADAITTPSGSKTLGSYKVHSRDHFLTNDLSLRLNAKYWKVFGMVPYLNMAVRNDLYLVTNSKTTSNDRYFQSEKQGLTWLRSRHHRPYIVGLTGTAGFQIAQWDVGLEYYHQVLGSFAIPEIVRANYSQLYGRSILLSVGYRL
jgi:hypothetical protein